VVTATCRLGAPGACSDVNLDPAAAAFRNRLRRRGLCDPRRLPVKTSVPCPKELIDELLGDIYSLTVDAPVAAGSVVLGNWKGRGIDVVAARTLD